MIHLYPSLQELGGKEGDLGIAGDFGNMGDPQNASDDRNLSDVGNADDLKHDIQTEHAKIDLLKHAGMPVPFMPWGILPQWKRSNDEEEEEDDPREPGEIVNFSSGNAMFPSMETLEQIYLNANSPAVPCSICGAVFVSKSNMIRHRQGMHEAKSYRCPCSAVFRWMTSYKRHIGKCVIFARQHIGQLYNLT